MNGTDASPIIFAAHTTSDSYSALHRCYPALLSSPEASVHRLKRFKEPSRSLAAEYTPMVPCQQSAEAGLRHAPRRSGEEQLDAHQSVKFICYYQDDARFGKVQVSKRGSSLASPYRERKELRHRPCSMEDGDGQGDHDRMILMRRTAIDSEGARPTGPSSLPPNARWC